MTALPLAMSDRARAEQAAAVLWAEIREWPWFVSVSAEGEIRPYLVLEVNCPVDNPGMPFCQAGPFTVYRRQSKGVSCRV